MQFHSAFERCVSRVIYKGEWGRDRTAIMQHNGWEKANSEVMISTPRRFGKTFRYEMIAVAHRIHAVYAFFDCLASGFLNVRSIAIFVACLCLSFGAECVIFSPARRASRKLLERICVS